jgi:spoIIIJ-associated protein
VEGESVAQVEATGETVGEAKWSALRELERLHPGIDKSAVQFQVVSEGERGLLGVGYAPARVIATAPEAAPVAPGDESALAGLVRELVERITDGLGLHCRIEVIESDEAIVASCSGRDLGMLIGKHGQTIDAIQYLANAILARSQGDERKDVVVDAAGYRERRRASLEALAVRSAERVLASRASVELDPMTAVERKVVHVRLKEFAGVLTTSEGTEPNRYVVIFPAAEPPVRDSGPVEGVRGNGEVPPTSSDQLGERGGSPDE